MNSRDKSFLTFKLVFSIAFILNFASCKKESPIECDTAENIPSPVLQHTYYDPELFFLNDSLDLDNDGLNDLYFNYDQIGYDTDEFGNPNYVKVACYIEALNEMEFSLGTLLDEESLSYACLELGDVISENFSWTTQITAIEDIYVGSGSIDDGVWSLNQHQGYIAFRSTGNASIVSGWLKAHYDTYSPTIYLEEMASIAASSDSISVGQTE